jgi:hypothetical protein
MIARVFLTFQLRPASAKSKQSESQVTDAEVEFPSPLWGGIKGGGREVSLMSPIKNGEITRPPPLTPPRKGEGNYGEHVRLSQ